MFDVYKLELLRMVINYLLYKLGRIVQVRLFGVVGSLPIAGPVLGAGLASCNRLGRLAQIFPISTSFYISSQLPETYRFHPSTFQAAAFSLWDRILAKRRSISFCFDETCGANARFRCGAVGWKVALGASAANQASNSCVQAGFEADPSHSQ